MPSLRRSLVAAAAVVGTVVATAGLPSVLRADDARDAEMAELRAEVLRLQAAQAALEDGFHASDSAMDAQRRRMEQGLRSLDGLRASLEAQSVRVAGLEPVDLRDTLREDVLRPVFQIVGEEAVGSGVLVHRGRDEQGEHYLALSCQHVLRDILAEVPSGDRADFRFELIFDQLGEEAVAGSAELLAENPEADLALLRIPAERDLGPVARIAPLARAEDVRPFTPVYNVGCPLGTGAQATLGQITRDDWTVAGQPYWMISSPAYFGNSGGGVFLEDTHELVGVFSKIYTHGSYRPQVITHMGLAVPLEVLHGWLRAIGREALLPPEPEAVHGDARVEDAGARTAEMR